MFAQEAVGNKKGRSATLDKEKDEAPEPQSKPQHKKAAVAKQTPAESPTDTKSR